MNRGIILENIAKLNTFVMLSKANDFLSGYVDKIFNNKCRKVKFSNEFDCNAMELLYSSLQLMTNCGPLSKDDYNKIDKKELRYYLDKVDGINYFNKQVKSIKNEEILVNYLKDALETGSYVCNYNDTVKFDNGLIVDIKWVMEFINYLIESINNNKMLSSDSKVFSHRIVMIDNNYDSFDKYIKGIKIYDYSVTKKGKTVMSFQNVKYLLDLLGSIKEYDFELLKNINSQLTKNGYTLSVNKSYPNFNKEHKKTLRKLFEDENYELIEQYIRDNLNSCDSIYNYNRKHAVEVFDNLKVLAHAYRNKIELKEVRDKIKLYSKDELICALTIGDFYINYIYDEKQMNTYFNYDELKLESVKPSIIDYETDNYKKIIKNLSLLNKTMVSENRKINRYLGKNREEYKEKLEKSCIELDNIIKNIRLLREKLDLEKSNNSSSYNINRMKINGIKDAIISGNYSYQDDMLIFRVLKDNYSNKFYLEIPFSEFIEVLLSDYNRNLRISFYQL